MRGGGCQPRLNPSPIPRFPDNREISREFCKIWGSAPNFGAQSASWFNGLQLNSLRTVTGNFRRPNREYSIRNREFCLNSGRRPRMGVGQREASPRWIMSSKRLEQRAYWGQMDRARSGRHLGRFSRGHAGAEGASSPFSPVRSTHRRAPVR